MCAVCRRIVHQDGPLGYVHTDTNSRFGEDGHEAVAVREVIDWIDGWT